VRAPAAFLLLVLAAAAPALGDRTTAEFFTSRGETALKAKSWEEAEGHYRRAMEEDPTFLPARHGLAQALLGSGRTPAGIEELRSFLAAVGADASAPAEWKSLAAKAEKQLADVDVSGAEFRRILDRFADDYTALARKWTAKDARTADAAARRALLLRPGDRAAEEIVEKLGGSAKGPPVVVFNGADLDGWEHAKFPQWQVMNGVIIGDTMDGAYEARSPSTFEGDFDVRAEIRMVEERPDDPMPALLVAWKGNYDYYGVGLINRKIYVHERNGEHEFREVVKLTVSEFTGTLDPAGWNLYEVRLRGKEIAVFVNGTEVSREPRPPSRTGGFVALLIQDGKAAYRKIEVQPR